MIPDSLLPIHPKARFLRLSLLLIAMRLMTPLVMAGFSDKVVEKAVKSTVLIVNLDASGEPNSVGSGFVINKECNVVTNYHVVDGTVATMCIFILDNMVHFRPAKLICKRKRSDLAVLKVERPPDGIEWMTIATEKPKKAQEVMAIGFPALLLDTPMFQEMEVGNRMGDKGDMRVYGKEKDEWSPTTFPGNVGKLSTMSSGNGEGSYDGIAHSAKISGGNSGGPLIDLEGRVVGINAQISTILGSGNVDYGFAIQTSELIALTRSYAMDIAVQGGHPGEIKVLGFRFNKGLSMVLLACITLLLGILIFFLFRKPHLRLAWQGGKPGKEVVHVQAPPAGKMVARQQPPPVAQPSPAAVSSENVTMQLRGRDRQGRSFDASFDLARIRVAGGRLVIGRNRDLCHLHIMHESVSRQHATLTEQKGTIYVEDRNSGNGTRVSGRSLSPGDEVVLNPGDRLILGEVELILDRVR